MATARCRARPKAFCAGYNGAKPFFLTLGFLQPHDICYWIMRHYHDIGDLPLPGDRGRAAGAAAQFQFRSPRAEAYCGRARAAAASAQVGGEVVGAALALLPLELLPACGDGGCRSRPGAGCAGRFPVREEYGADLRRRSWRGHGEPSDGDQGLPVRRSGAGAAWRFRGRANCRRRRATCIWRRASTSRPRSAISPGVEPMPKARGVIAAAGSGAAAQAPIGISSRPKRRVTG